MSAVPALNSDALRAHMQGHRNLTRRVIAAFPADQFETFSVGGMRPFGSIVRELLAMSGSFVKAFATDEWGEWDQDRTPISQAAALATWDANTAIIDQYWEQMATLGLDRHVVIFGQWPGTITSHLFYMIDNEIHHRAQGYVYLRALGIEPPPFWERG
jgi:uncharacterized damage-inducible protein DinB